MSENSNKPKIISKITVIKLDSWNHLKIMEMGDKVVVRQGAQILFNNLKNKLNFDKWWNETVDGFGENVEIEVIKTEIVSNDAMTKIHSKYK